MHAHHFSVQRTAHFYTLGEPGPHTAECWLALHGYGQLAKYFLRRFDAVADEHTLVAAPEALSRYYTDQEGTRVGASWMTKEQRLADIEDNMAYLDALYDQLKKDLPTDCRFILLGFSQGCATLMRWVMRRQPPLSGLVLYAGSIPDDLAYAQHHEYMSSFPVHVVYGDADEYLNNERLAAWRAMLDGMQWRLQYHVFEGGHVVSREVLALLKQEFAAPV